MAYFARRILPGCKDDIGQKRFFDLLDEWLETANLDMVAKDAALFNGEFEPSKEYGIYIPYDEAERKEH